jgi:hypothetical protein
MALAMTNYDAVRLAKGVIRRDAARRLADYANANPPYGLLRRRLRQL